MRIRTQSHLVAVAALLVIAACGRKDQRAVDTATGSVAPATPATPASTITVGDIDVGRSLNADRGISDRTTTFRRTDTIYVSVATQGSGSGTLASRWTFQDGQVVDESSQNISPTGPARTEFHVMKPDGWPVGKYRVEILLNGTSVGTKEFEVK
jgi:hypothetical protein